MRPPLRKYLIDFFYATSNSLGLNWLLRRCAREDIAVLMYHGLAPDESGIDAWTMVKVSSFRRQMQHLQKYCNVISAGDLFSEPATGSRGRSDRRKVMITFDDGYRSNYEYAYPILQELRLPATIFVATGFVDTTNLFWYDKVIYAIQCSQRVALDLRAYGLGVFDLTRANPARRWDDIQTVLTAIKTLDFDRRERLAESIAGELGASSGNRSLFYPLKREDILAMHRSGLIAFGSHTDRHEILTQLTPQRVEETVATSLTKLRGIVGEDCRIFSYPNGDHNEQLMALMRDADIDYAFTTCKAFWKNTSSNWSIPRIGIGGYDSFGKFAALVSGLSR